MMYFLFITLFYYFLFVLNVNLAIGVVVVLILMTVRFNMVERQKFGVKRRYKKGKIYRALSGITIVFFYIGLMNSKIFIIFSWFMYIALKVIDLKYILTYEKDIQD